MAAREEQGTGLEMWTTKQLLVLSLLVPAALLAADGEKVKVNGYAEYRQGDVLVVEGQRLLVGPRTKVKGDASSVRQLPLGYQIEAEGRRLADGSIEVRKLVAKRNRMQLFEEEVLAATNQLEASYRKAGQFLMAAGGRSQSLGELEESGPRVERVRRIVDRILPPYISSGDVRVYVIDNEEWNAMAMGNFSIYVFSGLMDAVDDDELAIVLGHEIAHASHEHTRKQHKRNMWIQLGAAGAAAVVSSELDGTEELLAGTLAGLGALAFTNGYSRDLEDQADRVGLRYAHEGGYDVSKGPQLWQRFADKYGEADAVTNTLFGDHSRSSVRARELEEEIRFNYGEPGR